MKAIIIGGGIAGLTTALALRQAGIDYEAAAELKPVGAGISLSINAMRVYRKLGLAEEIAAAGAEARILLGTDAKFRVISVTDPLRYKERYGVGFVFIHRARLQEVLLRGIDEKDLHVGRKLEKVEEHGDQVTAHFADGSIATGDFLIGADGIHSAVRQQLFPASKLRYSGQTCWRGVVNFEMPTGGTDRQFEAWGGELRFGCTPIGFGEVYWFAVKTAPAGGKDTAPAINEWLSDHFRRFSDPVPALIRATDPHQIIRNDIYDLAPMPSWHQGRVLLIGDAAHATTPNMGQGGCQAAEDAHYLGKLLKEGRPIPELFQEFERLRRPKVNWIVEQSWRFGKIAHWRMLGGFRNWVMRQTPQSMIDQQLERVFEIDE